jgi:hypothetical protein
MQRFQYVLVLIIAFAVAPIHIAYTKDIPSFEIYLTLDLEARRIHLYGEGDWSKIRLAESPLISASDIIRYNFEEHAVTLRPEAYKRMPKPPLEGTPFVVMANGERIYLGAFSSGLQAFQFAVPTIEIYDLRQQQSPYTWFIDRGYSRSGTGPDPRGDPRIKSALTALGLISVQPAVRAKATPLKSEPFNRTALSLASGQPAIQAEAPLDASGPFPMRTINLGNYTLVANGPLPSPDGNHILNHSRNQLSIRDWGSSRDRIVVGIERDEALALVAWSPDGKYIAFNTLRDIQTGAQALSFEHSNIRLYAIETGEIKTIPGTADANEMSWSPDSLKLALLTLPRLKYESAEKRINSALARPGSADFPISSGEVRLAEISTGGTKVVGSAAPWADFTWSPDSKHLAFLVRQPDGKSNVIHTVVIATGDHRTFPFPKGSQYGRALLGTSIPPLPITPGAAMLGMRGLAGYGWTTNDELVLSAIQGSSWKFFLMPITTGAFKEICSEPAVNFGPLCHSISPNGAFEVFTPVNSQRIMLRDTGTNLSWPVIQESGEEKYLLTSPDGRLVVFSSNRQEDWALYVAPLDRKPVANPIRIASLSANPSEKLGAWWTPAGRLVLGLRFPESNIYRINMDLNTGRSTGNPVGLTRDAAESFAPAVSPDGVHIAYWHIKGSRRGLALINSNGQEQRFLLDYPIRSDNAPQLGWRSEKEILFFEEASIGTQLPNYVTVNIETRAVQRFPYRDVSCRRWTYLPSRREILISPSSGDPTSIFPLNAMEAAVFSDSKPSLGSAPRLPLRLRSFPAKSDNIAVRLFKRIMSALKLHSFADSVESYIPRKDDKSLALDFAVSPDVKWIAYTHINNADLDAFERNRETLMYAKIPVEIQLTGFGGEKRTLLRFPDFEPLDSLQNKIPAPQSFSPDGRFLLYTDTRGRQCVAAIETGANWPLANLYGNWKNARWIKDGSIIATKADSIVGWKSWEGATYDAVIKLIESRAK